MAQKLFTHIDELLSLQPAFEKQGRHIREADLGLAKNQALYVDNGRIAWLGPQKKIPKKLARQKRLKEISLKGHCILPGLVECHTHTIFAGHRGAEFELRNQGVSYQEIARQGGGILSTMAHTRKASAARLQAGAQRGGG